MNNICNEQQNATHLTDTKRLFLTFKLRRSQNFRLWADAMAPSEASDLLLDIMSLGVA